MIHWPTVYLVIRILVGLLVGLALIGHTPASWHSRVPTGRWLAAMLLLDLVCLAVGQLIVHFGWRWIRGMD